MKTRSLHHVASAIAVMAAYICCWGCELSRQYTNSDAFDSINILYVEHHAREYIRANTKSEKPAPASVKEALSNERLIEIDMSLDGGNMARICLSDSTKVHWIAYRLAMDPFIKKGNAGLPELLECLGDDDESVRFGAHLAMVVITASDVPYLPFADQYSEHNLRSFGAWENTVSYRLRNSTSGGVGSWRIPRTSP